MKKTFLFLLSISFILSACGFSEDIEKADALMDEFFAQRIAEGGTGEDKYYTNIFIASIEDNNWRDIQKLVTKANGKVLSYKQTGWNINKKAMTGGASGTFITYTYTVTYEKGSGTESFELYKPLNGEELKIRSHYFDSKEIKELLNKGVSQAVKDI